MAYLLGAATIVAVGIAKSLAHKLRRRRRVVSHLPHALRRIRAPAPALTS